MNQEQFSNFLLLHPELQKIGTLEQIYNFVNYLLLHQELFEIELSYAELFECYQVVTSENLNADNMNQFIVQHPDLFIPNKQGNVTTYDGVIRNMKMINVLKSMTKENTSGTEHGKTLVLGNGKNILDKNEAAYTNIFMLSLITFLFETIFLVVSYFAFK